MTRYKNNNLSCENYKNTLYKQLKFLSRIYMLTGMNYDK